MQSDGSVNGFEKDCFSLCLFWTVVFGYYNHHKYMICIV